MTDSDCSAQEDMFAEAACAVSWRWLLAGGLLIMAPAAIAVTCSVGSAGVAFGSYDVFSMQDLDGAGTITVTCDVPAAHTLAMTSGIGSFASRKMASGGNLLAYNLYTDATRTVVWGDGTSGTSTVSGTALSASYSVYGRIPSHQNLSVGSYTDNITVTISF